MDTAVLDALRRLGNRMSSPAVQRSVYHGRMECLVGARSDQLFPRVEACEKISEVVSCMHVL